MAKTATKNRTSLKPDPTIQATNGYYTAQQARLRIGRDRVSFNKLVKALAENGESLEVTTNMSDRRSKLYLAEQIDRLARRAVPTH